MTKKEQLKIAALSRDQIAEVAGLFTEKKIDLDAVTAEMNGELDAVRARYAGRIGEIMAAMSEAQETVQVWSEANKDAEFDKARSLELPRAFVGFRLGNFKVVCAKGIKQADAAAMLERLPWGKDYVRHSVELNKEQLIADREKLTAAQTAKAGIAIVQEEHWFIEAKVDEPAEV